jgi:hypothetical protein
MFALEIKDYRKTLFTRETNFLRLAQLSEAEKVHFFTIKLN